MERIEAKKEDWVFVATDDDGTQAYMDMAGVAKELDEAALFKVWLKHIPPPGSKTYAEIQRLLTKKKRGLGAPHHVKQIIEIDCFRGVSRNLSLVVCDRKEQILHVVHYRFPEWAGIKDGGLLSIVSKNVQEQLSETVRDDPKPLSFKHAGATAGTCDVEAPGPRGPDGHNGNGPEVSSQTSPETVPLDGQLRLQQHEGGL